MKLNILFALAALLTASALKAQPPQAFNYQAVARDFSGSVLQNHVIALRISLLSDSATGNLLYSETLGATTNQFGLFTVNIGTGTVIGGVFSQINWANSTKWLKVEMDAAGGSNYLLMNTSQLLSVPYALYSAASGTANSINTSISTAGDTLYIGNSWYIVPGIVGH